MTIMQANLLPRYVLSKNHILGEELRNTGKPHTMDIDKNNAILFNMWMIFFVTGATLSNRTVTGHGSQEQTHGGKKRPRVVTTGNV